MDFAKRTCPAARGLFTLNVGSIQSKLLFGRRLPPLDIWAVGFVTILPGLGYVYLFDIFIHIRPERLSAVT